MLIYRATFQGGNPQKATQMEPKHYQKWFAEAWAEGKGETRGFLTKPEVFHEFLEYPRFICKS